MLCTLRRTKQTAIEGLPLGFELTLVSGGAPATSAGESGRLDGILPVAIGWLTQGIYHGKTAHPQFVDVAYVAHAALSSYNANAILALPGHAIDTMSI